MYRPTKVTTIEIHFSGNRFFSKYLHLFTLKTKTGPSVASAFRSIFDDPKYSTRRRPVWVETDNGKDF